MAVALLITAPGPLAYQAAAQTPSSIRVAAHHPMSNTGPTGVLAISAVGNGLTATTLTSLFAVPMADALANTSVPVLMIAPASGLAAAMPTVPAAALAYAHAPAAAATPEQRAALARAAETARALAEGILQEATAPTYGAEFTFTNEELLSGRYGKSGLRSRSPENEAARDRMRDRLKERCQARGDCRVRSGRDRYGNRSYQVTYRDGWWFRIAVDPAVVEIQTKPSTLQKLKGLKKRIQQDIFGAAHKAGLDPYPQQGQGHIHIGVRSAFGDAAQLFRDFFVDFQNQTMLWNWTLGQTGNTVRNAPPISHLTARQQKNYYGVLREFDGGQIRTIQDFARQIQKRVYGKNLLGGWPPDKYHALNVRRIARRIVEPPNFPTGEQTLEVRALRSQHNASEFLKLITLFEARIRYLKSHPHVPIFRLKRPRKYRIKEAAREFYHYVAEAGLRWEDYLPILYRALWDHDLVLAWTFGKLDPKEYREPQPRRRRAPS